MRCIAWSLAAVVACSTLALPGQGQAPAAILQASGSSEPDPVTPGTTGIIKLALRNAGNVSVYLIRTTIEQVPAGIELEPSARVDLGGLAAGAATTALPYVFRVPPETAPGVYQVRLRLEFSYLQAGSPAFTTSSLGIPVRVQAAPVLLVDAITPSQLASGQATDATLILRNHGPGTFSNVLGSLDSAHILVLGGGNSFHVASVAGQAAATVPLRLLAQPDAPPGLYALRVNLSYQDAGGTRHALQTTVGVQVQSAGQVIVTVQGQSGSRLTLAATNIGATPVTAVQVRLLGPEGATAVLGNLEPGEFLTATFEASGHLRAEVSYTDLAGNRQTVVQDIRPSHSPASDILVSIQEVARDRLVLAVTNGGREPLNGVQVELRPERGLELEQAATIALGPLEPGAFHEASFDAKVPGGADGAILATVLVHYTASDGSRRTATQTVERGTPPEPTPSWVYVAWTAGTLLVATGSAWGLREALRRRRDRQRRQAKDSEAQWRQLGETPWRRP